MSLLVFDIETRVDKTLLRQTQFADLEIGDDEAYERMRDQLRHESGGRSDFFPVTYHVPISIALVQAGDDCALQGVEVLGADRLGEDGLVREFWRRVEAFEGTLVSFNGRGFDLPVLELAALRHGCSIPRYFQAGFRYRYSDEAHYDLYDFLTNTGMYSVRGGFHLLANLIGLPGKGDVDGADVQGLWEAGRLAEIQAYCRRDVVQSYFLFLRMELIRGRISTTQYEAALAATAAYRAEL